MKLQRNLHNNVARKSQKRIQRGVSTYKLVFVSSVSQSRLFARDGTGSQIKEQRLGHKWPTRLVLQVHLDKQVPTGAGLVGGSDNLATALWAANQMNGNIASEKDLQAWSAEIGSDCPFFFSQGAAYCTSRGEVVGDIAPPIPLDTPMVLIKPKEECSTAEVYKMFSMERVSNKDPEELLRESHKMFALMTLNLQHLKCCQH